MKKQIIKYRWEFSKKDGFSAEPFIVTRAENKIERTKLFERDFNFIVEEKQCIGYFSGGKNYECPDREKIESGWTCKNCTEKDDFFLCVKCDGSACINKKQREGCKDNKYFIYLAGFDSLIKVGISHEFRVIERFVEQGADIAAKIGFVKDGKEARIAEQHIKSYLDITDRISGMQKYNLIFGNPNTAIGNIISAFEKLKSNGFSSNLIDPEIYDLRAYFRLDNITRRPTPLEIMKGTVVKGKIVAAKGNILILRSEDNFHLINAHSLIGRIISENQ